MTPNQVRNTREYRERNFQNMKCVYCAKPSLTYACEECRRRRNASKIWNRWFISLFTAASLMLPVSVSAQTFDVKPYAVMLAGNMADLWTTKVALDTGRAHEGNPALNHQGMGRITAVKVGGVSFFIFAMRVLETHGHPKAARLMGYIDGGAMFGVVAHNLAVVRR